MDIPTTDSFFLCRRVNEEEACAADDVAELFWLPLDELKAELFGLSSIRRSIPILQDMFRL